MKRDTVRAWQLTLAAGLVMAVVVWGLLEWLRRSVDDVDEAVDEVWTAGKRLAQNTQAVHLLETTARRASELASGLREGKT